MTMLTVLAMLTMLTLLTVLTMMTMVTIVVVFDWLDVARRPSLWRSRSSSWPRPVLFFRVFSKTSFERKNTKRNYRCLHMIYFEFAFFHAAWICSTLVWPPRILTLCLLFSPDMVMLSFWAKAIWFLCVFTSFANNVTAPHLPTLETACFQLGARKWEWGESYTQESNKYCRRQRKYV